LLQQVQLSGGIWVYSEMGKGTTFKVYLPRITEPVPIIPEQVSAAVSGGKETILLVEDALSLAAPERLMAKILSPTMRSQRNASIAPVCMNSAKRAYGMPCSTLARISPLPP